MAVQPDTCMWYSEMLKTGFLATHLIMVSAEKAVLPLISLKHELNNNQDQE